MCLNSFREIVAKLFYLWHNGKIYFKMFYTCIRFFFQGNAILIWIVFWNLCNAWKPQCNWMPCLIFNRKTKSTIYPFIFVTDINITFSIFHVSLKSDQILGVGLCVVKYHKNSRIWRIVNNWVIQCMGWAGSLLAWGNFCPPYSFTELPSQNSTPVYFFVVIGISRTVCVACRVVSIWCKIHTISINHSWK